MDVSLEWGEAELAAIVLAVVSFALLCTLIFRSTRAPRQAKPDLISGNAGELHEAMLQLQKELPHLLRDMNSKLDVKIRTLRELLHDAGKSIDQLRQLQHQVVARSTKGSGEQPVDSSARAHQVESVRSIGESAERFAAIATDAPKSLAADPSELREQRYSHVYALADSGSNAAEIAAETGMHCGEVELVLNMRRKRIRLDRASRQEPTRAVKSTEGATV